MRSRRSARDLLSTDYDCLTSAIVQLFCNQWRRNEFETGDTGPERKRGHRSSAKRPKKFWSCPFTFWP